MPDTMSETSDTSGSAKSSARVSLACVPCRDRHMRCDAVMPACSRCVTEKKQCVYLKSRRGGRRRLQQPQTCGVEMPTVIHHRPQQPTELPSQASREPWNWTRTEGSMGNLDELVATPISSDDSSDPDQLLQSYYSYFHAAHPCVLPYRFLKRRLATEPETLQLLFLVMQYIGANFTVAARFISPATRIQEFLASFQARQPRFTGFDVQAVLLFSIAVYWCDEIDHGLRFLDEAIQMALKLGMNQKRFSAQYGQSDPVLEESWRRTWWMIYIADAHMAGSTHTYPLRTTNIPVTVDMPCEEHDYESGQIPQPKSLQEYDMREFLPEDKQGFSSFAELIGLTRGIGLALAPGRSPADPIQQSSMCANADTSIAAWYSLLPPSKRDAVRRDGSLDELLCKANFILHAYTVEMHRQLSSLAYSPVEAVCQCSPPPPEAQRGCNTLETQTHTFKCLKAIEKLNNLMTVPINIATHTPFIICMIANATIAHLSACRYIYQGVQLELSREKIRLSMGTLKIMSEYWLQGKRIYQEVGIIAREILCLTDQHISAVASTERSEREALEPLPPDFGLGGDADFYDLFDFNFRNSISVNGVDHSGG